MSHPLHAGNCVHFASFNTMPRGGACETFFYIFSLHRAAGCREKALYSEFGLYMQLQAHMHCLWGSFYDNLTDTLGLLIYFWHFKLSAAYNFSNELTRFFSAPLLPDSPLKSELKPKLSAPTNVKSKQSISELFHYFMYSFDD